MIMDDDMQSVDRFNSLTGLYTQCISNQTTIKTDLILYNISINFLNPESNCLDH